MNADVIRPQSSECDQAAVRGNVGGPELSVVVIGRDEVANLRALVSSLAPLESALAGRMETIFVDSASSDGSAEVAVQIFDRVIVLCPDSRLSAAAGRYVGVSSARAPWILHLDGDMTLESGFVPIAVGVVAGAAFPNEVVAVSGRYRDIYSDGGAREYFVATHDPFLDSAPFGGAVMVRREALLTAGNWNPRVQSNEELDVLVRLVEHDGRAASVERVMVEHHTERQNPLRVLMGLFVPWPGRRSRFAGFGQLVRAAFEGRRLRTLCRRLPLVLWLWGGLGIATAAALSGLRTAAVVSVAAAVAPVAMIKGVRYVAVYLGFLPQLVVGWNRYDQTFEPTVEREFVSGGR